MNGRFLERTFGPGFALLTVASVGLALLTSLPIPLGVGLAIAGPVVGSLLRGGAPRHLRSVGLLAPLVTLGILVVYLPIETFTELAAGLASLALLLWCAEDPERSSGAIGRGLAALAVPAAVFGIALASSLLLPPGAGSLGIAAGLLAGILAAVAVLLAAPRAFDRDPTATS
jgi:hypothetical protein